MKKLSIIILIVIISVLYSQEKNDILKKYFEILEKTEFIYPKVWELPNKNITDIDIITIEELKLILFEEIWEDDQFITNAKKTEFKKIGTITNKVSKFHLFWIVRYTGLSSWRASYYMIVLSENGHFLCSYSDFVGPPVGITNNALYFPYDQKSGNIIVFEGKYPPKKIWLNGAFPFFYNGLNPKWEKVKELERKGKYHPQKSEKENLVGEKYYQKKKYTQAKEAFNRAINYDESNNKAWLNLGYVLIKEKQYEKGIKYTSLGIEYSTFSEKGKQEKAMGYYNLGTAYEEQGKYQQALENYQSSITLRKNKTVNKKIKELQNKN